MPRTEPVNKPFSQDLSEWLKSPGRKSLAGLNEIFAEKTFAVLFILMLALPALPIPTGGLTHVTEIIAMLASLEMIAGRQSVWLPKRWLHVDAGKHFKGQAGDRLVKTIRWFERRSRRRGVKLLARRTILSLVGLLILIFTAAAFVAPPFSGLDTLPALGVVIISLGLILEDSLLVVAGGVVGSVGIALILTAGGAIYEGLKHLF